MTILGHTARLPNDRIVFIGTNRERDIYYLGFVNSEKETTRISLSAEAYTALKRMMEKGFDGLTSSVPEELIKREWTLVES